MTGRELLRRLRRIGAEIVTARGKGGHIQVRLRGRETYVPTGSGEVLTGTLRAILRQLGLRRDQI